MIEYAIASYHRPECQTLKTLVGLGVPKELITISLNDKNDYEQYSRLYGAEFKVIYREGKGVACNRNTLLESYDNGARVLLLDDDIKGFKQYTPGGKYGKTERFTDVKGLEKAITECFELAESKDVKFFGFFSTENQMMITSAVEKDGRYSVNRMYQGGFCGFIINKKTRYDESYLVLDDYELILREIRSGGITFRRNDIVAEKPGMGKSKGGYFDLYKHGIQERYMMKLVKQYPGMFSVKPNAAGIRLKVR